MIYTTMGKEVLADGAHFADAMSPEDADRIALAMNNLWPLHDAARAYFFAASNRTSALTAPALRDALNAVSNPRKAVA